MTRIKIIALCICSLGLITPFAYGENFDAALYDSLQGEAQGATVWERIETNTYQISGGGGNLGEQIRDFLLYVGSEIVVPVVILLGILFAIIGFYKIMVSDTDEESKKGGQFILRGVIGIIVMVSAGFIADTLVGIEETTPFQGGAGSVASVISSGAGGGEIARSVYDELIYPFLGLAFDIIIGVLFLFVLIEAFKYLTSTSDDAQKKAFTLLLYAAIGTIIIIVSKALVELIYGQYSDVISGGTSSLEDIGTGVLEQGSSGLTLFYTVFNRVLGLAAFLVLVILIVQGYQLLINPNDEELLKTIQKNLGYIFIGILVVGAAYLIVNFFLITY